MVFEDKSRFWVFKSRSWKSKQFWQKNIGAKIFPQKCFLDSLEREGSDRIFTLPRFLLGGISSDPCCSWVRGTVRIFRSFAVSASNR